MNAILAEKLRDLPDKPGCYLMKDISGTIIYVGKAVNLKNRVRSYFRGSHDPKTEQMVANVEDFETVIVNTEAEALILESNLIKAHSPHFNILLRDDKHYPYLRLTMDEEYPRLLIARRAMNDGSRYFGPYPSAGAMHRAVELLRELYPLRTCKGREIRRGQRACLNAHIGRCAGPCEGKISREDYLELVEKVSLFLSGKTRDLIRREEDAMAAAAEELRYEDAARHRDAIRALTLVQTQQQIDQSDRGGDYHLLAVAAAEDNAEDLSGVQVFFIRGGNVVGRELFFLNNSGQGKEAETLSRFILEYYGGGQLLPHQLCCNLLPEDDALLAEVLSEQCGHKVELLVPQRGDKRRLMDLVENNARHALADRLGSRVRREEAAAAALEELRLLLDLPAAPCRIECYDISHVQGTHMVGSMTVFKNGVAAPKEYRKFRIKTLDQSNDFAALQEVLERRMKQGAEDRAEGKNTSFSQRPDILVIDGGKGQLSAVCERLRELGFGGHTVISLAKREEEVFLPGESEPLILPRTSPALRLLQQIRDEAHRFAITYHRSLRGKGQTASELDQVEGVGPARRKALLLAFGSVKKMGHATLTELEAVAGVDKATARRVYEFLHPKEAAFVPDSDGGGTLK